MAATLLLGDEETWGEVSRQMSPNMWTAVKECLFGFVAKPGYQDIATAEAGPEGLLVMYDEGLSRRQQAVVLVRAVERYGWAQSLGREDQFAWCVREEVGLRAGFAVPTTVPSREERALTQLNRRLGVDLAREMEIDRLIAEGLSKRDETTPS